jgi:hypothetical protein
MGMPLFFLLLGTAPLAAQQVDTTQKPMQLETLPSAPEKPQAAPRPAPAPMPPPVVKPVPADTIRPEKTTRPGEEKEPYDFLKKLFIGGSGTLGLQSNSYYGTFFNIGASPILGYKLNKYIAVGPGLVYEYYSIGGYKGHNYGLKGFGQVLIYKSFLAHFENQWVSTQMYRIDSRTGSVVNQGRSQESTMLLGGGYRSMASDRFGMDLYVLLPVNNATNTNDSGGFSPVIRAGFIYHLK